MQKLGIATRFYGLTEGDVERLAVWVDAALTVVPAEQVFVAIRTEEDHSGAMEFMKEKYPSVTAFSVTPWGKVVQAPNALLMKAAEQEATHLLYVSTEYPVTTSLISLLQSYFDDKTLVVGTALPGHDLKA